MSFLKGFRTYISCAILAVLGIATSLQGSCAADPLELGEQICGIVQQPWIGQAVVVMAAIAAWFRKLANK